MRNLFFVLQTLLICFDLYAQNPQLVDMELQLDSCLRTIVSESSYSRRDSLNSSFLQKFEDALKVSGSFDYPFDSLKNVGRLKSDDGRVRVFTWNIPQVGGTQRYFGFIQSIDNDKNVRLFRLNDSRNGNTDAFNVQLGVDNWLGALYYQIVTVKSKPQNYYVLMGYDYNNLFTSKKLIEVLSFSQTGQPLFGLKVFDVDGRQRLSRIVFEFAARASMTLRYEEKVKTIVFDHLSPSQPQYAGNLQHYGPDFSYDGFKLDNGVWRYVRDLDMRNSTKPKANTKGNDDQPFFFYSPNYKKSVK